MFPVPQLIAGATLTRLAAGLAVLVAGACTTAMNWRFSYQLGTSELDSMVWATFSVALDVTKWLMLPFAAVAWRVHKPRAAAAIAIWLVATIYSFAAALGFAALNRDTVVADRQSQVQLHKTLELMRQSPRWQVSAACADATAKLSREFCATYRATEAKIKTVVTETNPQTALIVRLTGFSTEAVNLMLAIFLAVATEVVSALGLFAILPQSQKTPAPVKTGAPWKPPRWQAGLAKASGGLGAARSTWTNPAVAGRDAPKKSPR